MAAIEESTRGLPEPVSARWQDRARPRRCLRHRQSLRGGLAALGAVVICADKNKEGVEATAADVVGARPRRSSHVSTPANGDSINALAAAIASTHKRLDIAVTTPAIHVRKLMLDYTDEEYDRVADLNLRGTFLFLRAFGRMMVRQGGGSLIASSSVRATTLEPGLAIYGATKAGIIQMVRGLASEVGPFGVRVNAIVPSIVETALVAPFKARPEIWNALASHTVFNRWARRTKWRRRLPSWHPMQQAPVCEDDLDRLGAPDFSDLDLRAFIRHVPCCRYRLPAAAIGGGVPFACITSRRARTTDAGAFPRS